MMSLFRYQEATDDDIAKTGMPGDAGQGDMQGLGQASSRHQKSSVGGMLSGLAQEG